MVKITVRPSRRGILIGKTGSGKTEVAKWLFRPVAAKMPVVIVDRKHDWLGENPVWATRKEQGTIDKPRLVTKFDPSLQVQCFQPDGPDEMEAQYAAILKGRRRAVYIDECRGLATATSVPPEMGRVWTQGRSLQVPAWVGSQSGRGIPLIFKSQADEWIILESSLPDILSVEEYIPLAGQDDGLSTTEAARYMREMLMNRYHLYYYNSHEMHEPKFLAPIPYKEKKKRG